MRATLRARIEALERRTHGAVTMPRYFGWPGHMRDLVTDRLLSADEEARLDDEGAAEAGDGGAA